MQADQRRSLRLILLLVFVSYAGFSLPFPVLTPLFLEGDSILVSPAMSYSSRTFWLAFCIGGYSVGQFLGSMLMGLLSDRYGRRTILLGALAGAVLSYVFCTYSLLAGSVPLFIMGRLLGGFCEGSTGIAQAFAADISHGEERVRQFSRIHTCAALGWVVGPVAGSLLSTFSVFGLHRFATLFVVTGGITVLMWLLLAWQFHDVQRPSHTPSVFEAVREIVASGAARQLVHPLAVNFLLVASFACFQQFFPTLLVARFGADEWEIGLSYTFLASSWVVAQQLVVVPATRRLAPAAATRLFATGMILSFLFIIASTAYWMIACGLVLVAAFASGVLTNVAAWVSVEYQGQHQGAVLGVNRAVHALARSTPALFAGYLAGIHATLPILAGAFLALLPVVLLSGAPRAAVPQTLNDKFG